MDTRPPCVLPDELRDGYGCYPIAILSSDAFDCQFVFSSGEKVCFSTGMTIEDKHGHVVDGDSDPLAKGGCDHRDTPEWQAEHKGESMETTESAPIQTITVTPPPAPAVTTSTIGVDAAIEQVKTLAPEGAGAGLLIGGAAVLAVVGAAIKIVPNALKDRHEAEMKRLEIEQAKTDQGEDKHKACAAERAMLESKVAALQSKLDEVAAKAEKAGASSMSLDGFDPDELEQRLKKIEGKLRGPGRPPKKKV
jgi:hypothetical protein